MFRWLFETFGISWRWGCLCAKTRCCKKKKKNLEKLIFLLNVHSNHAVADWFFKWEILLILGRWESFLARREWWAGGLARECDIQTTNTSTAFDCRWTKVVYSKYLWEKKKFFEKDWYFGCQICFRSSDYQHLSCFNSLMGCLENMRFINHSAPYYKALVISNAVTTFMGRKDIISGNHRECINSTHLDCRLCR